jgi:short-subunit dehydrogenase
MNREVIIITGASTGIGEALALRYAARGAAVVLTSRRESELGRVAADVRARGGEALVVSADVSIESDCKRIIDTTIATFGRIDTLINNAGITMWATFDSIQDISIVDRIMRINYLGAVYCTHHALPHLKASRGRLVGIASLTGLVGVPTRSAYAASKHAMRGFFDSLRIELADTGVTVTMIYPGFVATGIRENATGADGKTSRVNPVDESKVMSVDECTTLTVRAIDQRKREDVMTTKGKLGQWLKLIAPGVVDNMARKAVAGNLKFVQKSDV